MLSIPSFVRGCAACVALTFCAAAWSAGDLAIVDARVYPAPGAVPIDRGTVLVRDGRIAAIGHADSVDLPDDVARIDADGAAVTAGLWNAHVHFTEPMWADAATAPASRLTAQLRGMLTQYGFTTVVDLGSDPRTTLRLRERVLAREVAGPRILTAGSPIYPPDGVPYYVSESLPPDILQLLSTPDTPESAREAVRGRAGMDVVKLFAAAWVKGAQGTRAKPMPVDISRAAVAQAHAAGALVFAHPSDAQGLRVVLESGVDVLAHAVEDMEGTTLAQFAALRERGVVIVPTLHLFSRNDTFAQLLVQVREHVDGGGALWFGTDVGYLHDHDPAPEVMHLHRAGLDFDQILAMLTTAPASRLPGGEGRGELKPGAVADLVVHDGDPAKDPAAWTRVRYTIRDGDVIHAKATAGDAR